MADEQIFQSGPLFLKISLSDAKCFDFAQLADFDDKAAVLYSSKDARVQDENHACAWFFSTKA